MAGQGQQTRGLPLPTHGTGGRRPSRWLVAVMAGLAWLAVGLIASGALALAALDAPVSSEDRVLMNLPHQPTHYPAPPPVPEPVRLPRQSLPELEARMTAAPEVLIAAAELDEKMSRLDHTQARSGLELQGNAGIGGYRELTGVDATRDYSELSIGGRLRYPLLGRYERQKIDIAKAEARTWESRHKLEMARLSSRRALRNHYIEYWGSASKIELL